MGRSDFPILIVDDDQFILKTTSRALQRRGLAQVYTASSARSAAELLQDGDKNVQLIFLDLNMPDVDGVEFLRELSDLNFQGGVVLMSGEDATTLSHVENLAKARKLNMHGSIVKPATADKIFSLLDTWQVTIPDASTSQQQETMKVTADELRAAIDNDELEPWFQPKIDVTSGRPVGVEMLARWKRSGTYVPPNVFIPVAESAQLIDRLTFKLFKRAVQDVKNWHRQGIDLHLAINVSIKSLYYLEFTDRLIDMMSDADIALIIEVTESHLMKDLLAPLDNLLRLKLKQVGLSIDNFGTGGSNLDQLNNLPFTELKIDLKLIQAAVRETDTRNLVFQAIKLARKNGLATVAEGLENKEHCALVREMGFDYAQGYYLAKPMNASAIPAWAHSETSRLHMLTG